MALTSTVQFRFYVSECSLEVVRFELKEGVSEPFRLNLELSSFDDALNPNALLDCEATFTIERDGITERTIAGIITAFESDETGSHRTRYRAVVESPLSRLALRHNSRIFQQVSSQEILGTLLKEHGLLGTRTIYSANHEAREYCVQYREPDSRFFHRLATEEGIVHWHEVSDGHSTLVLSDKIDSAPLLNGPSVVYQPQPAGDAPGPHLSRFAHRRQLAPTRCTQREYTFKNPRYDLQHEAKAFAVESAVGDYEHYDYAARYKRDEAGKPFTRSKLSGLRNQAEHARIEGDDARLHPALAFDLIGHPLDAHNDRWRVIEMHHEGEQATSQEADSFDAERGTRYRFEATIVPAHYDWKPSPLPQPIVEGPQIAHVVGPPGEEIHCDEHGRVQVWFPWDREGPRENATCWIRVSQGWAGTMYGFMALPRIGHEVLVSFLEGDPDQPIVTGRAYHAANRPPYKLPTLSTLTTFKSQEHHGAGHNELLIDDTTHEVKTQLRSTHAASQLSLGYLTHPRGDDGNGPPRGEGFELRSDAGGALRAPGGLLLSAERQPGSGGRQLDISQLWQCVQALTEQVRALTDAATSNQALPVTHAPRDALIEALGNLGAGANDRREDSGAQPVVAISAPAGLIAATPRSVLVGAGDTLEVAAARQATLTSGERTHLTAGQGISLFACDGGLRQIAHRGPINIQAQHDSIVAAAEQDIRLTAEQNWLLQGAQKGVMQVGKAGIVLHADGLIELFGTKIVAHAEWEVGGPESLSQAINQWPQTPFNERFRALLPDGAPARNRHYRLVRRDGTCIPGVTDDEGRLSLQKSLSPEGLTIEWLPEAPAEPAI